MHGGRGRVDRRTVLRTFGALGLLAAVPAAVAACASPYATARLTLATGGTQGVYYALGNVLADVWRARLGLDTRPEVLSTAGSVDNLRLLTAGRADVVFSQVDTAADQLQRTRAGDPHELRALARIYDDVVHVVVPAESPATSLVGLRGSRVSVGAPESGVAVIARRLLAVAGLAPDVDFRTFQLGINDSVAGLESGELDAFFWVGGLPTEGVTRLAAARPIRLLDLDDLIGPVRDAYPVYAPGTVPAGNYRISEPITTLLVRNFLLVARTMPDDMAYALVESLFAAQEQLTAASPAALTIDPRSGIGTQPVPLHPGAERFFQAMKPI
ncbi:C4-dicarboxylate ABC transporter substrate-binding protein [Pseudonocardia sp. CNS-139]|nr:C4-dicarboxylate ABC transporter substrate-binding protein [Pseudonocardia sp. CNS-139]